MKPTQTRFAATLLAYIYWPLLYIAIYLPFIIPRLVEWKRVPLWILLAVSLGFAVLLAGMGTRYKTKANAFHAIGITVLLSLFMFMAASLSWPGFKKPGSGSFNALASSLSVLIIFALLETGRIVATRTARDRERRTPCPDP
jgi:hypothetical protein